ncbi:MAG: heme-binding protein [Candidatus Hydrogenedens sp.]|nr:heme-binding protein [Candidatus Hydrogenedens sp.]
MFIKKNYGRLVSIAIVGLLGGASVLAGSGSVAALAREEVEQPKYAVVHTGDGYEIREYAPQIAARVKVQGDEGGAMNAGFRPLADFIFGNNTTQADIAMTSPVTQTEAGSQEIAMTSPVTQTEAGEGEEGQWVMFIMPGEYTLDTLPKPNNERVELVEIPARAMAVITFSGWGGSNMMQKKREELETALAAEGFEINGKPTYARYDPPWTMPWRRQNEVMLPVVWPKP